MEKPQKSEVVNNVPTVKKKYVKPEFEVIDLNWEAPLLSASADAESTSRFRTINRENW